jgi:Asp-tRNA(Asn)/Glu-tRNA(Gln) amidotransferase B subunit
MIGTIDNEELSIEIAQLVRENLDIAQKVKKSGKTGPIMHLVGKIMKKYRNKADP